MSSRLLPQPRCVKTFHPFMKLSDQQVSLHHLFNTHVEDDTNIIDHINNLHEQQNALTNMGKHMSDQEFKSITIMLLPKSWDMFTASYQGTNTKWK
jgi:gag-polypeptide of LTR copia-type